MEALRDTSAWGEVLADAWEIAAELQTDDMSRALVELATRRIGTPIEVGEELTGAQFFWDYVVTGRPIRDVGLIAKPHGEWSHLIQDLVVDKALGSGASKHFRQLLGKARGMIWKGSPLTFTDHILLLAAEDVLTTGDYVWRFTYDLLYPLPGLWRLPQPEAAGPILKALFGMR
jgi:hypothetical protein